MGRKQYSEPFKQDAVKLVTEQGYSVAKAAKFTRYLANRINQ